MKKYYSNEIVEGLVTGIEKYGIFVNIDEYYSGLIHISEISDRYVDNINNYARVGDKIRVRILDGNYDDNHIKLSIKNVDYRVNDGLKHIKETGSGFEILKKSLNGWIEERKK